MGGTTAIPSPADLQQKLADGIDSLQPIAESIFTRMMELEKRLGVPYPFNFALAFGGALIGFAVYIVVSVGIALVIPVAVPLITLMMSMLMKVRQDTVPAQAELSAAALSEFLGTEIDPSTMKTGTGPNAAVAVARQLGDALYNRLYTEFGLAGVGTPGPGEKAARTFSGFAVNFATQNAMISTLADAISLHELEQFRELGVEAARNLGIGRLQRMALGTLLDNVIRKPYTRELQARLRPTRMTPIEYVHARNRGDINQAALTQALQEAGYTDADIPALLNEYTDKLTLGELVVLERYGKISEDTAVQMLQSQGLDSASAAMRFQAAQLSLLNDNVKAYVDSLNQAVRARTIDSDTWSTLMDKVPWTDDEKQWTKLANGAYLDFYAKMLTWAQVVTAYEQGIVDVDYVEKWLLSKGYSPDDITNMELLLAVKYDAFAAAAAKKGKTASPPPAPKPAPAA
jgi:uncharacterized protein Smg (DUF494 family)